MGVVTSRKILWVCAAHYSKPLPNLRPKSAIFPTLISYDLSGKTRPSSQYLFSELSYGLQVVQPDIKASWRAFAGLTDSDEKVASPNKHTGFEKTVQNHTPYLRPK